MQLHSFMRERCSLCHGNHEDEIVLILHCDATIQPPMIPRVNATGTRSTTGSERTRTNFNFICSECDGDPIFNRHYTDPSSI